MIRNKAKPKPAKAPGHLREPTRKWFSAVLEEWELQEHHRRLLLLAAEAWDRGQQAREAIDELGMVYTDRFDQPAARPEVAIERDCRIAFARLLRELALDVESPEDARPPGIGANAGLRAEEEE